MQTVKLFFKTLLKGIFHHNIMYLGSIIAYFGFASTIPLTLLLIFFASLFINGTAVEHFLDSLFQSFIPSMPKGQAFITTTIDHLTQFRTAVGVIGIVGLLLSSVGGFLSLQTTLDTICEVSKHRSFIKEYMMGFVLFGFLLVLILVSSLLSSVSPDIMMNIANFDGFEWVGIVPIMSQILFLLVMFATCFLCYRILPSATLSIKALLTGATVVTIGVYIARQLFAVYTHYLGNFELIYGTLAFTTLVTFWIYIVSVLFLFGMELCVTVDCLRGLRPFCKGRES